MALEFDDINKITSTLFWFGPNTMLRVNASLWTNSPKYGRRSYHRETRYYNEKANKQLININLEIDSFLTIEQIKANKNSEKAFIKLRTSDLFTLRSTIEAFYHLLDKEYNSIFKMKDGKPIIAKKIKPVEMACSNAMNYLVFSPDIIENRNGDENSSKGGVRINLSSMTNYVLMDMTKLLELREILNTINLPMYGQMLVNYIGMPKLGTNMYQVGDSGEGEGTVSGQKGRTLDNLTKQSGYFNRYGLLDS